MGGVERITAQWLVNRGTWLGRETVMTKATTVEVMLQLFPVHGSLITSGQPTDYKTVQVLTTKPVGAGLSRSMLNLLASRFGLNFKWTRATCTRMMTVTLPPLTKGDGVWPLNCCPHFAFITLSSHTIDIAYFHRHTDCIICRLLIFITAVICCCTVHALMKYLTFLGKSWQLAYIVARCSLAGWLPDSSWMSKKRNKKKLRRAAMPPLLL